MKYLKKVLIGVAVGMFIYGCTVEYDMWQFESPDITVKWEENKVN